LSGELAIDKDGNFLGLRIGWLVNLGAYCSNAGPFINTAASPTSMASNAYRTPAVYGLNRLVFTTTTPTTAYRGAGRPNASYLMERLVDEAAASPASTASQPRRRNCCPGMRSLQDADCPTYDSGDPQASWRRSWRLRTGTVSSAAAQAKSRGRLRGIGCAAFIEPSSAPARRRSQLF
jgi:carbon-monoxide dehydrogenase large subunit